MRNHTRNNSLKMLVLGGVCAGTLATNTASAALPFMNHHERGTIENIDPQSNKLTVLDAHKAYTKVYSWDQDTKFVEHKKLLSRSKIIDAADVKPGEQVKVFYKNSADPTVARKVVVTGTAHTGAIESQPAPTQS